MSKVNLNCNIKSIGELDLPSGSSLLRFGFPTFCEIYGDIEMQVEEVDFIVKDVEMLNFMTRLYFIVYELLIGDEVSSERSVDHIGFPDRYIISRDGEVLDIKLVRRKKIFLQSSTSFMEFYRAVYREVSKIIFSLYDANPELLKYEILDELFVGRIKKQWLESKNNAEIIQNKNITIKIISDT